MIEKLINRLNKDLNDRKEKNLYREVKLYSGYRCNLSSNDYFQLRYHPKVISKAKEACEIYGTGSGASPLLSGFLPCHKDLLDEILKWKQKPCGMLFNSGYAANQSILKYLPGKKANCRISMRIPKAKQNRNILAFAQFLKAIKQSPLNIAYMPK